MSQHLHPPLPLHPSWLRLPHDAAPPSAPARSSRRAGVRPPRGSGALGAALVAVPMVLATLAGVALAVAPLA